MKSKSWPESEIKSPYAKGKFDSTSGRMRVSPARGQESEGHHRGTQRARIGGRCVKRRIGDELRFDNSRRRGRQRPAHRLDAQLRYAGGPQGHTIQTRAEIGVTLRGQ